MTVDINDKEQVRVSLIMSSCLVRDRAYRGDINFQSDRFVDVGQGDWLRSS